MLRIAKLVRSASAFCAALFSCAGIAVAEPSSPTPSAFAPIAFLLSNWTGAGTSDAGAGSGSDSFALALDGRVVMRRAHSVYPGGAGKPSETYDGLMVIYPDTSAAGGLSADSYDNGGHVIHYALVSGSAPNVAQFVSDGTTSRPTFRLTYALHGGGDLDVLFELAPPGSGTFTTVAHGTDRRSAAPPN